MKSLKFNSFIAFALSVLLITGLTACQQKQLENSSDATLSEAPASQSTDADIAGLLASLNMRHFKKPVKAPEFELASVNGGTVNLNQYRGDVVLLSFWTTW